MFETSLAGPEALADVDDDALVATITGWSRVEAAAAAHRLAAIGELVARRISGDGFDRSRWVCDNWDGAAAELAAAEHISHGMASSQMYLASALRDRIPRVAALFLSGRIGARLASAIAWHTTLITDPGVLLLVDTDLADLATSLGPLSVAKAAAAIDALIERHDPAAVRRTRDRARGRELVVDTNQTEDGTTAVWGRLFAVDAAALDQRLMQLAHSVCDDDPRTLAQRRADALGALAAGAESLACACGSPDCPAAGEADARSAGVVVYVVAESAALDAAPDPQLSGEFVGKPEPAATRPARPQCPAPSGRIIGGGKVPPGLLAELIAGGAAVKPLSQPADLAAEPGYRPSATLAAFIRARDMSCRFPGCDRPATVCDIDHAVPFPWGPTHPSNLRCLCRKHHLLKTFWTGRGGWCDRQLPDGSIDWRSPTGHVYTTRPGSSLLFPSLCLPTTAPPANAPASSADRNVMMPRRKSTRIQDRLRCIEAERAYNLVQRDRPPP
ncbi:HNH endonuclease [Mycobacterium sp. SVM_VP21]|nr:HNH endonuclease [Mycobacterium sp. SVM_VP21]